MKKLMRIFLQYNARLIAVTVEKAVAAVLDRMYKVPNDEYLVRYLEAARKGVRAAMELEELARELDGMPPKYTQPKTTDQTLN